MTAVFDKYARYYDLLYKEKDYSGEGQYVHERLMRYLKAPSYLLELGCGTGRHALEFARLGWQVKGYDVSAEMVEGAQRRAGLASETLREKVDFDVGDIRSLRDPELYDAAISLFHVMSYQVTNRDLADAIATAALHLKSGGVFLFDFWFGPAVLSDPPVTRVKRLQDKLTNIVRIAEPEVDYSSNCVTVNYEITVEDRATSSVERINEKHRMRYLFLPELEFLLNNQGMELLETGAWMSTAPAGKGMWYSWALAQKKDR
jgi:SAM-dependent methyltransferase